ncbi:Signal recognition particle protein Ffh [Mycoplasma haemocanis str. Illinois]|uniref:signal-recognition-particle GTPase n=1 Tax=Mycoplasma haemocanis (strain Illinois) TaxID=1111676 RepID=H6N5W5_MYCHN|nr:signal recognition particle receptor subunit alpha [Mycoplasma haemocanis]AEW44880.1 Signal recognition particle protein Ffh [Mycoplasma haemocanis str. Illinois]
MLKLSIKEALSRYIKRGFRYSEIKEEELAPIFREIRIALLNSDVNLKVVKSFLDEVKLDLLGKPIDKDQELDVVVFSTIKRHLINILGTKHVPLNLSSKLNKILIIGLNGSGKTTTVAKISKHLSALKGPSKVRNISLDIYRPGAFDQLKNLSNSFGVESYFVENKNFSSFIKESILEADKDGIDFLVFDSYGLLSDNENLMRELSNIKQIINPSEVLFVLDAMAGQEILDILTKFNEEFRITGLVISKADSLSPMGAAFSASYLFKLPIKFLGDGETVDSLSAFHPERIASLILGEGDILSLAEKIEKNASANSSQKIINKMMRGHLDLDDLVTQIREFKKMGSLKGIMKLLPGDILKKVSSLESAEEQLRKWEILISSMTLKERKNPKLFKKQPNRKVRVIKGSGMKPDDFNKLMKRWEDSKKRIEELSKNFKKGKNPFSGFF